MGAPGWNPCRAAFAIHHVSLRGSSFPALLRRKSSYSHHSVVMPMVGSKVLSLELLHHSPSL
jgi:hypothetical protein